MDDRHSGRQAHLSLRWETRVHWRPLGQALGISKKPEQASAVALALYAEAIGQGRPVSYSRRKGHYDMPKRYRSSLYTYDGVVGAVDCLEGLGLISNIVAEPGSLGWQSFMTPNPELIAIVGGIVGQGLTLAPLHEPILLRDESKKLIDYTDSRQTRRLRDATRAQNEAISATEITGLNGSMGHLRRIFNQDFSNGGRFYAEGGAWQTMSKDERLKVRIAGERVIEIDYSEIHPVLAYAECGSVYPGNAYDLPGIPRGLTKIAVAILLNSSSRNGARYTLAHEEQMAQFLLGDDLPASDFPTSFWQAVIQINPGYPQGAHRTADEIIDALLDKHAAIRSMFFTGAGTRLQRRDSDIADAVMTRMRKIGVVVLPVHDSFLVPESKADLLEEAMIDEALRHGASVKCKRSLNVSVA